MKLTNIKQKIQPAVDTFTFSLNEVQDIPIQHLRTRGNVIGINNGTTVLTKYEHYDRPTIVLKVTWPIHPNGWIAVSELKGQPDNDTPKT